MRTRGLLLGLAVAAAVVAAACSDAADQRDTEPPAPPVVRCIGGLDVAAVRGWPGGGVQVVLAGHDDGSATPAVRDAAGATWASAAAPIGDGEDGAAPGLTVIVVEPDPATGTVPLARLLLAQALLEAWPPAERLALVRGGAAPQLFADLTADRAHLERRLAELSEGPVGPSAAGGLVGVAAQVLAGVGAAAAPLGRDILVLDGRAAGAAVEVVPGVALAHVPDEAAAADVVTARRAARADRRRIGACPPAGGVAPGPLTLEVGASRCTIDALPRSIAPGVCDADAAARDAHVDAQVVTITMTAAERAVWDGADAAGSEEPLRFSLAFDGGVAVPAHGHFRGQTSLGCKRKSLAVDLGSVGAQRWAPGLVDDEVFLISLCKDDGYFRQAFAEVLLAAHGLFALDRRFVRLVVDGEARGVYWLLEKPSQALVADALAPRAVIRRRFDPDDIPPDVNYPGEDEAAARDRMLYAYGSIATVATGAPPDAVLPWLRDKLDLDGYLTWIALASLLENGDHTDEVFFAASEERREPWFRVTGWDPDDIGTACHHGGVWAIADPCGLLYCAEADLDQAIVRSPAVYARYRAVLARVLAAWPAERIAAAMAATREDLFTAIADDATAAAMPELQASVPTANTAAGARAAIETRMAARLAAIEARRGVLEQRLAACKDDAP